MYTNIFALGSKKTTPVKAYHPDSTIPRLGKIKAGAGMKLIIQNN